MVGCAGEGEVVDVGGAAVGPFGDVVDFAEVSGHMAAGVGAATILGVQHEALIRARDAFRTPEVQGTAVVIEDR
ncbi:hypothetical protein AN916_27650 [Mycobacteroides immunogenum]|nr:hypothetical protein TL11_27050 [Mycobacteroides immunogenum]KPG42534.1 hypothetical protein AN916_27650 [Mycobacteroides immunogenum]